MLTYLSHYFPESVCTVVYGVRYSLFYYLLSIVYVYMCTYSTRMVVLLYRKLGFQLRPVRQHWQNMDQLRPPWRPWLAAREMRKEGKKEERMEVGKERRKEGGRERGKEEWR